MGIQRLITIDRQAVTSLSATSVSPSDAIKRVSVDRSGNGRIELAGPYTGDDDIAIDVEIVSGGDPGITLPSFAGVGSGSMTDLTVDASATPQKWNFECTDLGVDTDTAEIVMEGAILRALTPGSSGNSITITIDQSGVVVSPSGYSTIEQISSGISSIGGAGFDWDTVVGTKTNVPETAKRIMIGDDSTIYRQWKYFEDGDWVYQFMPEIAQSHPVGAKVSFVTGSRTVVISDGVTTESYAGVVTVYDLLSKIMDAPSSLVEVVGVMSPDMTTDNQQAVIDMRSRTDAHVQYTSGDGSKYATGFIDYAAGPSASTEIIVAECFANDQKTGAGIGAEKWKLSGSVSGELGAIITDELYSHPSGKFDLRIEKKLPDGYGSTSGDISSSVSYAARDTGDPPKICVDALRLGPNAQTKKITWTYTKRPSLSCECDTQPYKRLSKTCLDSDVDQIIDNPEYKIRLDLLNAFFRKQPGAALDDPIYLLMLNTLNEIFTGSVSWGPWAANTSYDIGDTIESGDYKYMAETSGTTGASAPAFPVVIGDTVVDGGVTWACVTKKPLNIWDERLWELKLTTNDDDGFASAVVNWGDGCSVEVGDRVIVIGKTPDVTVTVVGVVTVPGTLGQKPDYITATSISYGQNIPNTGSAVLTVDYARCSGQCSNLTISGFPESYCDTRMRLEYSDYRLVKVMKAASRLMLLAAEVSGAGIDDECWSDDGGQYWWVPDDSVYLPAFTNIEYHSVKRTDEIISTNEFGFVIKVLESCIQNLKEGDSVTITIGADGWPPTYQVGDKLYLATIAAGNMNLIGGVDGNDSLTFTVSGSISGVSQYVVNKSAPALYDNGQITARINPGGIGFELGDSFSLCVEDGQFRWRLNSGSWSAPLPIQATALVDGVSVDFVTGACPGFVAGDSASFVVYQPNAVSNAIIPDDDLYTWDSNAVITAQTAGVVDTLIIGMHTLSSSVIVSDGTDSWTMTARPGMMVLQFDSPPGGNLQITVNEGGSIGWIWAGQALQLDCDAANESASMKWSMNKGVGINATAMYLGRSQSWVARWDGFVTHDEMNAIMSAIHAHKKAGDIPAGWIPAAENLRHCSMVKFPDTVEFSEFRDFSCQDENIDFSMSLEGWYYV